MANFVFDTALGRVREFYNRVDTNDPAASTLVVVLLATAGPIESDATLKTKTTLSAVFAGTTDEAANSSYARKVLTDADLAALPAAGCDIPDANFGVIGVGDVSKILVCYTPSAGADTTIIPLTAHDFVGSPDGVNPVVAQIATAGFFGAS